MGHTLLHKELLKNNIYNEKGEIIKRKCRECDEIKAIEYFTLIKSKHPYPYEGRSYKCTKCTYHLKTTNKIDGRILLKMDLFKCGHCGKILSIKESVTEKYNGKPLHNTCKNCGHSYSKKYYKSKGYTHRIVNLSDSYINQLLKTSTGHYNKNLKISIEITKNYKKIIEVKRLLKTLNN